jgi:hypothetical protein
MADIAVRTNGDGVPVVSIVESYIQRTVPNDETVAAGAPVRLNTTTGKHTNANGSGAAEARIFGIQVKAGVADGQGRTAIRKGVLDGFNLDALAYDAPVYLSNTDGRLGDVAGTVSVVVGRVIPGKSELRGNSPDKLLFVDL